jgi:hypothetical protein
MADGNPFQSMLNPNAARVGLYDMRMMQTANRMELPFERSHSYGHQGIGGNPMLANIMGGSNQPDYSVFTTDPAASHAARQALSPYGLAPLEANQVQRNTILPNTGFFGSHPNLSAALEGGAYGALAAHGGATIGDSIQGTLEGIVGGRQLQQGAYNRQFAKPFEAARMMEGLEDLHQKRDLQEAEIQHYRAMNTKLGQPEHPMRSIGNAGPQDAYIPIYNQETGKMESQPNPNYDPALVRASHREAASSDLSIATREQLKIAGVDPAKATPTQLKAANQAAYQQAIGKVGASTGARASAEIPYQNETAARHAKDEQIKELNLKKMKSDDTSHVDEARMNIMMHRMSIGSNNLIPSDEDIQSYINQKNGAIDQQINQINQDFDTKWPRTLEQPATPKNSSRQTGSSTKGTKDDPHVLP